MATDREILGYIGGNWGNRGFDDPTGQTTGSMFPSPEGMPFFNYALAHKGEPFNKITWNYWGHVFPEKVSPDSPAHIDINNEIDRLPPMPRILGRVNAWEVDIMVEPMKRIRDKKAALGIPEPAYPSTPTPPPNLPAAEVPRPNIEPDRTPNGASRDTAKAIEENILKPQREAEAFAELQKTIDAQRQIAKEQLAQTKAAEEAAREQTQAVLVLSDAALRILAAAEEAKKERIEREDKADTEIRKLAEDIKALETRNDILDPKRVAERMRAAEEEARKQIAEAIDSIKRAASKKALTEQDLDDLKDAELTKYDQAIKDYRENDSKQTQDASLQFVGTLESLFGDKGKFPEQLTAAFFAAARESQKLDLATLEHNAAVLKEFNARNAARQVEESQEALAEVEQQ